MKNYEILIAFTEGEPETAQKELINEVTGLVEKNKGQIISSETWGKRNLASPIGKNKNAFYWFISFSSGGNLPKILTDALRIEDKVLRFLVTEQEKPVKVSAKKKTKKPVTKKLDEMVVR